MPVTLGTSTTLTMLDLGQAHIQPAFMQCPVCGATVCRQTWSHETGWAPHAPPLSPITGQAHTCQTTGNEKEMV